MLGPRAAQVRPSPPGAGTQPRSLARASRATCQDSGAASCGPPPPRCRASEAPQHSGRRRIGRCGAGGAVGAASGLRAQTGAARGNRSALGPLAHGSGAVALAPSPARSRHRQPLADQPASRARC
ncbi:hypothetical protein NN561_011319 [Cricetulus griseus]